MTQNILVETVRAKSQKFFYRKIKEEKFFKETVCSSAISREPNILQESHENKWQSAHFWPSEIRRIYVNKKYAPEIPSMQHYRAISHFYLGIANRLKGNHIIIIIITTTFKLFLFDFCLTTVWACILREQKYERKEKKKFCKRELALAKESLVATIM